MRIFLRLSYSSASRLFSSSAKFSASYTHIKGRALSKEVQITEISVIKLKQIHNKDPYINLILIMTVQLSYTVTGDALI